MAKKKYYAVAAGVTPGIYETWDECKEQVESFAGNKYQGFAGINDAIDFMKNNGAEKYISQKYCTAPPIMTLNDNTKQIMKIEKLKSVESTIKTPEVVSVTSGKAYAFTDGSFNSETNVYGFGGMLVEADGKEHILQGSGQEPDMVSMRNVSGEIWGAVAAIRCAKELGIKELDIFYDYKGIEEWAMGRWKTNKTGTIAYKQIYNELSKSVKVNFVKVKAHTGVLNNEVADKLAKEAVGILLIRPAKLEENNDLEIE